MWREGQVCPISYNDDTCNVDYNGLHLFRDGVRNNRNGECLESFAISEGKES